MSSDGRYARKHKIMAKRDANEPEIIEMLESCGATVSQIAQTDLPDLICDDRGELFWVEVKMPGETLSEGQDKYHRAAIKRGVPIFVVDSIDDVPGVLEIVRCWN